MKLIQALCLLCLTWALKAARAGPVRKTNKTEDNTAPQEEVNVLMYGAIQFSETFRYVYETTEAKIAKIGQTMKSHERTLQKLKSQTEQAAQVEEQIKEFVQWLQVSKHRNM